MARTQLYPPVPKLRQSEGMGNRQLSRKHGAGRCKSIDINLIHFCAPNYQNATTLTSKDSLAGSSSDPSR